ncbi:763_t:CDS:1, partial [Dentiscutata heterogama]
MSTTILEITITFWCYLLGSGSLFKVNIGINNDICDLKRAIISTINSDIAYHRLRIWGVNVATKNDVSSVLLTDDNELKEERNTIANTFCELENNNIRVVIRIPIAGESIP